jgi:hypothetical protein
LDQMLASSEGDQQQLEDSSRIAFRIFTMHFSLFSLMRLYL